MDQARGVRHHLQTERNTGLKVNVDIAEAFRFLLTEKARYKVVYGGRGKGASWNFARAILVLGLQRPMRVLCTREIQKTIDDSVHQLFKDQISALGLQGYYVPRATDIVGPHGTTIGYAGLRHNVQELRSWEGADLAWVTEATSTSRASWNILTPTIRKDDSEIWVDLNPELETDFIFDYFVTHPPQLTSHIVRQFSWKDNPFFNNVLRVEKDELERRDPEEALTVWGGHPRQALKDAIYADEMIAATRDGRITHVPIDERFPVDTYWDLGHNNLTTIWFIQKAGFEWHAVDYYENSKKKMGHYLEVLQERKYLYGMQYLPHDAASETLGSESIKAQVERHYPKRVVVVPRVQDKVQTHNAVKTVFPTVWFDKEKCADGLQGLRHYKFKREKGQLTKDPLHDWASDVADGFGTFALARNVGRRTSRQVQSAATREFIQVGKKSGPDTQWMGS